MVLDLAASSRGNLRVSSLPARFRITRSPYTA
jgi:hypothetical protein